jgi:hypothetical protein
MDERELREIVGRDRVVRMSRVLSMSGRFTRRRWNSPQPAPSLIGREELSSLLKVAGTVGAATLPV